MAEQLAVGTSESGEFKNNTGTLDEQGTPRNEHDPLRARRLRRRMLAIGTASVAGVATLVAGGVFAFGGLRGGEAPQPRPTAGAGLAPGEGGAGAPATPETSEPSQEATPVDMNQWTIDDFEYNLGGETIKGVDALEAKYGISVAKYPTGEAAAKQLINNVNIWINSLDNEVDKETYAPYSPLTNGDDQLARAGGVAHDLVAPAWQQVLTTTELGEGSAGVQDPTDWINTMRDLHVQNIQDAAQARNAAKADGKTLKDDAHKAEFEVHDVDVLTTYQDETAFIITMTFTGPDRTADVVMNVTMRQVKGSNGEKMWKIISLQDKEVK